MMILIFEESDGKDFFQNGRITALAFSIVGYFDKTLCKVPRGRPFKSLRSFAVLITPTTSTDPVKVNASGSRCHIGFVEVVEFGANFKLKIPRISTSLP